MFTIPDKGEGLHNNQSILFQEYIDVLVAGISSVDCVLSGCAVTAQATPDMTVAVASGSVRTNSVVKAVTGANATIAAADATNPRFDLIVIDSAGAIAVRAGTAAAAPKPPAKTANDVVLAVVYVPAADTAIDANQIVDLRVLKTSNVIRQVVSAKIVAATGTTEIPDDDTVPLATEGTEVAKVLITPGTTTNRVLITGCATVSYENDTASGAILAFFRGTTNIGAVRVDGFANTLQTVVSWAFEDVPGSTAEMSYTIRIGMVSGTVRWKINARPPGGTAITDDLGGSMILSRIVATEIVA